MSEQLYLSDAVLKINNTAHMVWTLLETFVNMELSRMNELDADAALQAFGAEPWTNPNQLPGDLTFGS